MRFRWTKCLVVLVSLALASGNAHAALSLDDDHSAPCPVEHDHHHAPADAAHRPDHHDPAHHHDKGHACCCECLGCTAAADVTPVLTVTPRAVALSVRFEQRTASWVGQALDPELDPPRPDALI